MARWVPLLLAAVLLAVTLLPATSPTAAGDFAFLRELRAESSVEDAPATRGEETTHFIEGTVYEAARQRPLSGARVELTPGPFAALTGRDGHYRFEVPSNAYRVRATHPDFRESWARLIPALPGTVLMKDLYLVPTPARTGPVTIDVPGDTPTIADAVHAAADGDVVRIAPGRYRERVFVERSITLTGSTSQSTIVDAGGIGSVIAVAAPNVTIRGLTLFHGDWGVYAQEDGLRLQDSLLYLNQQGLRTTQARNGLVEDVAFLDNWQRALHLTQTTGFVFRRNTFIGNGQIAFLFEATDNRFHSNDFLGENGGFGGDPALQTPWANEWSLNGRGNYWDTYEGEDVDGDGVGDTLLPMASVDIHPLVDPVARRGDALFVETLFLGAMAGFFFLLIIVPVALRRRRP